MNQPHQRNALPKRTGRRFRDLAALLPFLGIFFLATPIVSIFTQSGTFLGLPSPIFFVFGVWAGLIVLAFGLARRARRNGHR